MLMALHPLQRQEDFDTKFHNAAPGLARRFAFVVRFVAAGQRWS
jgi:hypothetical protein